MRMKAVYTKEFEVDELSAEGFTPQELADQYFDLIMEDISQKGVTFLYPQYLTDTITIEITEIPDVD